MSTLHLTDSRTAVHADQCVHATPHAPSADPDVIVVALAGSPATWYAQWDGTEAVDGGPATFVVDDAADWSAGHPRERVETVADTGTDVSVETVGSAGNLTDLGVTLTEVLESHRSYDSPTALCFQSLTVLLQYAAVDPVCRFLHTLIGHVDGRTDGLEATAHFHLHERAHEDDTVDRLRPLFDRVRRDPE